MKQLYFFTSQLIVGRPPKEETSKIEKHRLFLHNLKRYHDRKMIPKKLHKQT